MKCRHYACRCARAADLMAMSDRTGSARLAYEATQVHDQEVECRMLPPPVELAAPALEPRACAAPGEALSLATSARTENGLEAYFQRNCEQCD